MTTHTVRRGETLSAIARRYGANVVQLQHANGLADPNLIRAGMTLAIPRERPFDTPPPTAQPLTGRSAAVPPPSHSWLETFYDDLDQVAERVARFWHGLSDETLVPMREQESAEAVQHRASVTLPARDPQSRRAVPKPVAPRKRSQARLHRDEVLEDLKTRLNKVDPVVIAHKGTRLTRNERKKIVAGIGLCEINYDVFSTHNPDGEFAGKFDVSYARVVHIGLSYGYIQFSQDSGNLGKLLKRMRGSDQNAFDELFKAVLVDLVGSERAQSVSPNIDLLLHMTNEGLRPDELKLAYRQIGPSGQKYWNDHRHEAFLKERYRKAHTDADKDGQADLLEDEEIRGARVQRIAFHDGRNPEDIWTGPWARALQALGNIPLFQDVQLDMGVDNFLNKVLSLCQANRVRTGQGLAFVGACRVRSGNPEVWNLFFKIAKKLGKSVPFAHTGDEIDTLKAIAKAFDEQQAELAAYRRAVKKAKTADEKKKLHKPASRIQVKDCTFDVDEGRRAKTLLANEFGFLDEDFYDPGSYGAEYDK